MDNSKSSVCHFHIILMWNNSYLINLWNIYFTLPNLRDKCKAPLNLLLLSIFASFQNGYISLGIHSFTISSTESRTKSFPSIDSQWWLTYRPRSCMQNSTQTTKEHFLEKILLCITKWSACIPLYRDLTSNLRSTGQEQNKLKQRDLVIK